MAELGFGMMRLPLRGEAKGDVDLETVSEMADRFLGAGFSYLDTAYYYHDGMSEVALREAVTRRHPRGSFRVADKLPLSLLTEEGDPAVQRRILEEQLARCGVDRFDSYLLHNACRSFLPTVERLDSFGFLRDVRDTGLADRVGVSVHDDAEYLSKLLDRCDFVDFVQLQVNYLDWESPTIQSRACYEEARSRGLPVIVMEPVRGGGLADPPDEARRVLERAAPGESPASLALRFAAGLEGVEVVLSGMSDMAQVEGNVSLFKDPRPLDAEELDALGRAAAIMQAGSAIPCTGCNYCVGGCPMDIPIPEYFSIYNTMMRAPAKGNQPIRFYYHGVSIGHGSASDCIGCGRCETVCPQHIPIREGLSKVSEAFGYLRGRDILIDGPRCRDTWEGRSTSSANRASAGTWRSRPCSTWARTGTPS